MRSIFPRRVRNGFYWVLAVAALALISSPQAQAKEGAAAEARQCVPLKPGEVRVSEVRHDNGTRLVTRSSKHLSDQSYYRADGSLSVRILLTIDRETNRPLGSVWYDANDAPLRTERWFYGEDGKIKETILSNPNGEVLFIETQDSNGTLVILDADRREIPYEQWEEAGVESFDPYNL